jgi:RNA polymerase sigma-32 factor
MGTASESSALTAYRSKLAHCPPLSQVDEKELALAYREGDIKAGEKLIRACLPFVVSVAMEYRRWGVPMEDIIQQGNVGLLRAASRYEPAKECRLITYAAYWIRAEIRDYLVRAYRVVRLGTTKGERRALRLYRTTRQDDPVELAAQSGLSEARARQLLPVLKARDVSLDAESSNTGATVLEKLANAGPSPEEMTANSEMREQARKHLQEIISELSPREQLIVQKRWQDDDPVTLEKLGVQLGVSKERVRQIEERTRSKLRARLEALGYQGAAA